MFQFGETLSEAQIQSVLFVPLHLEGRVIGILGAYCEKPERFGPEEVNFFRLAAGLVAVALENARAYETVTTMSHERTWFMMKVAHNLRAPLAGMLSILKSCATATSGRSTTTRTNTCGGSIEGPAPCWRWSTN
jgi:transcriptional regulator with GAF, ATPase, and Fis domain